MTTPTLTESDFLTARHINAYVFCPRLFWLEHILGEFADNEHTIEGRRIHRRVDKPGGSMPPPEDSDNTDNPQPDWHTRSLWLSDPELGVSAKLDLVELVDNTEQQNTVMPVDTKKGKPAPDNQLWPADRVQLVLQALLLQKHGYPVTHVAAWYHSARKRVQMRITSDHIEEAYLAIKNARTLTQTTTAPLPLIDSPKCPGCSLNSVCLPDEINALRALSEPSDEEPIRRIQTPRDDALPLYVQEPGTRIGLSGQCLKITPRKDSELPPQEIGLGLISQLNLMGSAQITTQAMQACLRNDIPVSFFSTGGWFYGRASGTESRQVQVRIAQFKSADSPKALEIARVLIADKIANSRVLLRRNADKNDTQFLKYELKELKAASKQAEGVDNPQSLLGIEGNAARRYFKIFSQLLARDEDAFAMQGRTRRPPQDPTNAMLSFGYALLTKDCTHATIACGLDAYLGVFHTAHHGRPSMALDIMEPFRPLIVDSMVLQMVRRNEVKPEDFIWTGQAVAMKDRTRKKLIQAYERRMDELVTNPTFGYRISYRRTLYVHARLLSRVLTGELDKMPSFRTR